MVNDNNYKTHHCKHTAGTVFTVSAYAQKPPGLLLVSQQPLLHVLGPLVQSVWNQLEPAQTLTAVKILMDREERVVKKLQVEALWPANRPISTEITVVIRTTSIYRSAMDINQHYEGSGPVTFFQ